MKLGCARCTGSAEPGWVCEEHPDKPWQHDGCGAAGARCACNPEGRVHLVRVIGSDVPDAPGIPRLDDDS